MAAWLLLELGLAFAAVIVAGPEAMRRAAALALVLAGGAFALLAPPLPLLRVCLALLVLLAFMNVIRFAFGKRQPLSWRMRAWQLISLFDVADLHAGPRPSPSALLRSVLCSATLVVSAFVAIRALPAGSAPWPGIARVALGAALLYGMAGVLSDVPRLAYAIGGVAVPANQRAPILAESIADFWGRRWNRFVSGWLDEFAFAPLARGRRPVLGLLAAFGASAALHAWAAFVPLGLRAALQMASYFLVEAVLLLAERSFRLRTWPRPLARAWTVAAVAGPSPLGIDPFLRTLGL